MGETVATLVVSAASLWGEGACALEVSLALSNPRQSLGLALASHCCSIARARDLTNRLIRFCRGPASWTPINVRNRSTSRCANSLGVAVCWQHFKIWQAPSVEASANCDAIDASPSSTEWFALASAFVR